MHFTFSAIASVAALFSSIPLIHAHVGLINPGTYLSADNLPPLAMDGSDYPCSVPNFDSLQAGEIPTISPGQTSSILLYGTAVHGGGSCQVSITYDSPPTKGSTWKVLKSFENGCPIEAQGNLPPFSGDVRDSRLPVLQYVLPEGLPSGKATIAWTWFNKIGNREMYMRCHKANVSGSGTPPPNSGDDDGEEDGPSGPTDTGVFDSLPNMFIANMYSTTCRTIEGQYVVFPNPGTKDSSNAGPSNGQVGWTGDCGASGQNKTKARRSVRFSKEHLKRLA